MVMLLAMLATPMDMLMHMAVHIQPLMEELTQLLTMERLLMQLSNKPMLIIRLMQTASIKSASNYTKDM